MNSKVYYGVLTDEGIGDIITGSSFTVRDGCAYLIVDGEEVEVYTVFTCDNLKILNY